LFRFLEHGNHQILPMLHRIQICREQVKLATNNSLDILDNTAFFKLKDILAV
jgi:hypothetical protein